MSAVGVDRARGTDVTVATNVIVFSTGLSPDTLISEGTISGAVHCS